MKSGVLQQLERSHMNHTRCIMISIIIYALLNITLVSSIFEISLEIPHNTQLTTLSATVFIMSLGLLFCLVLYCTFVEYNYKKYVCATKV